MENNRGQSIFLSVVGIATLLVAIIGATFAYFSITVNGNDTASSIHVTTATLGNVTFDGTGAGVSIENVYPGWTTTKTFTIQAAGADSTSAIQYLVTLDVATTGNTLLNGADFVYTLATDDTNAYLGASGTTNQLSTTASAEQQMPGASATLAHGTLDGNERITYTMVITLKETNIPQDQYQGKVFDAVVQITLVDGQGARTWDNANNTWSTWTNPGA